MRRFLLCVGGLPRNALDELIRDQRRLVGEGCEVVGKPLDAAGIAPMPRYERGYARSLCDLIYRKVEPYISATELRMHVCLIYLDYGSETSEFLYEAAFPACLLVPISAPQREACGVGTPEWNKRVLASIASCVRKIKEASRAIVNQVQSNSNRTPMLLPVRNFRSSYLKDYLRSINSALIDIDDRENTIRSLEASFVARHPRSKAGVKARPCFVDARQIGFVPPGSARHGYVRALKDPHVMSCVLASMFRLGAPFDRQYHYDCQYLESEEALRGHFTDCHDAVGEYRGNPHLNIACNDAIRGKQIGG